MGDERATAGRVDRLSRRQLDALQLERLRAQLCRVNETTEFYRTRFADAGFKPEALEHLDDISAVPFISKRDLIEDQEARPPLGTRLAVAEAELARLEITSGTSGLGQEIYGLTWSDIEVLGSMSGWTFTMNGIGRDDRIAVMLPLGYLQGPWGGHWGAQALGATMLHLGLAPDSATRLRYLERFHVAALYTPTPTYLMRLTNVASEIGMVPSRDLPDFRLAWLAGEPYPVEWAQRMTEYWNVALAETYGSTQGAYASTCELGVFHGSERGYLHNADWHVLLEVVDPVSGEPVAPGEQGEAVVTTLVRQACPVVRFRTGDLVRLLPHDGCSCGRQTVAIEAGTIGRADDMIKIKGMNVWPVAVDEVILASGQVADYVGEITLNDQGYERVTVRLAFRPECDTTGRHQLRENLAQKLRSLTNVSMDLLEVPLDDLPTYEYKARRWIDHRHRDLAASTIGDRS